MSVAENIQAALPERPLRGGPQKQNQYARCDGTNAQKQERRFEAAVTLTDVANDIGSDESAQIAERIDQPNAGRGGGFSQ